MQGTCYWNSTAEPRGCWRFFLPDWKSLHCSPFMGWEILPPFNVSFSLKLKTNCDLMHVIFFLLKKCTITAYKDLQSRENTRNAAWQRDGWDEIVYYTGITQDLSNCWLLRQYWHHIAVSIPAMGLLKAFFFNTMMAYRDEVLPLLVFERPYAKQIPQGKLRHFPEGSWSYLSRRQSAAGLNGWLPELARDQGHFVSMPLMNHNRVHCECTMTTSSGSPQI